LDFPHDKTGTYHSNFVIRAQWSGRSVAKIKVI
jgi:hypothetical protein